MDEHTAETEDRKNPGAWQGEDTGSVVKEERDKTEDWINTGAHPAGPEKGVVKDMGVVAVDVEKGGGVVEERDVDAVDVDKGVAEERGVVAEERDVVRKGGVVTEKALKDTGAIAGAKRTTTKNMFWNSFIMNDIQFQTIYV